MATAEGGMYYRVGVAMQTKGKRDKAIVCYKKAILLDPGHAKAHYNLAMALLADGDQTGAELYFRSTVEVCPTIMEAWVNLSGLLLKQQLLPQALQACQSGLAHHPLEPCLISQANTILRSLGRQEEAIRQTWQAIGKAMAMKGGQGSQSPAMGVPPSQPSPPSLPPHEDEDDVRPCPPPPPEGGPPVVVVCVKWGTKYDAAYVNRLAAGVGRYTYLGHKKAGRGGVNRTYEVVCVTDDPEGIEIGPHLVSRVVLLPPDLPLQGWWVKAYLFSPTFPIARGKRAVYLDLDTVITGPLDDLLDYRGGFATLQTDGMANERRCGGINSSVMLWCAGDMPQVYTELMRMLPYSVDYARKFDHWLEMMTITDSSSGSSSSNSSAGGDSGSGNSSRGSPPLWLQELLPGCVAEYSSLVAAGGADLAIVKTPSSSSPVVVKGKGGGPRLVCFPLDPKPHHDVCTRQRWIRYHWLGEQDKPEE